MTQAVDHNAEIADAARAYVAWRRYGKNPVLRECAYDIMAEAVDAEAAENDVASADARRRSGELHERLNGCDP